MKNYRYLVLPIPKKLSRSRIKKKYLHNDHQIMDPKLPTLSSTGTDIEIYENLKAGEPIGSMIRGC